MTVASAVVFGAGSIGRGLLGQLLAQSAVPTVFVEAVEGLRRRLLDAAAYTVRLTGRRTEVYTVSGFRTLGPEDTEGLASALSSCSFAATAVGGVHLSQVAEMVSAAIRTRSHPLPLLLCENWPDAVQAMTAHLAALGVSREQVVCIPTSVERMVRQGENLELVGESCESLLIDTRAWPVPCPSIAGFEYVEKIEPYYKRKVFTNNSGHALLAYEGALIGCSTLCEALAEADIADHLRVLLANAARALHLEYGLAERALQDHVHDLLAYRFSNTELKDTVVRVGRDPLRKLGAQERLMGLLRLFEKHRLDATSVHRAMAAVLCYFDPGNAECIEMRKIIAESGPGDVLLSACGLRRDEPAFEAILEQYRQIRG